MIKGLAPEEHWRNIIGLSMWHDGIRPVINGWSTPASKPHSDDSVINRLDLVDFLGHCGLLLQLLQNSHAVLLGGC